MESAHLQEVHIAPQPIDRFAPLIGEDRMRAAKRVAAATARRMSGTRLVECQFDGTRWRRG